MKQVLLTGFEPFGQYEYNPTKDIALEYDNKHIGDIRFTGLVLPSTYYGGFKRIYEVINQNYFDAILSLGLSSSVKGFRIETLGVNEMLGKYVDADGFNPDGTKIAENGDDNYRVNSIVEMLAAALKNVNLHYEVSENADRFICNSLIYLTSQFIRERNLKIKNAFVHIPWTSDYLDRVELTEGKITISKDELRIGIEALATELVK